MGVLMRSMLTLVLLVPGLALWGSPADAQPQVPRTWVAAAGDDSNLCIRAAPCRTFVVAYARAAPGRIFVANNDAITILAQPTDAIVIDGLAIPGLIGGGWQRHRCGLS